VEVCTQRECFLNVRDVTKMRLLMTVLCCVDRGLSPATCEKIYIDTARYLDTYGVHMFPATWVSTLHSCCLCCTFGSVQFIACVIHLGQFSSFVLLMLYIWVSTLHSCCLFCTFGSVQFIACVIHLGRSSSVMLFFYRYGFIIMS